VPEKAITAPVWRLREAKLTLPLAPPVKVARLPTESNIPELEAKVPSMSRDDKALVKVALLSSVTIIPAGIITASVVMLKDGAVPPAQVELLLQLPEVDAV
jgi:hypothetical protein